MEGVRLWKESNYYKEQSLTTNLSDTQDKLVSWISNIGVGVGIGSRLDVTDCIARPINGSHSIYAVHNRRVNQVTQAGCVKTHKEEKKAIGWARPLGSPNGVNRRFSNATHTDSVHI